MREFRFPDGFLWGSATSAHQVEGDNVHSDWWAWEQMGKTADRSGRACEQWQRFADDFDLAASLGHTAHRFSIEWSRLEPAEDEWRDEPLVHYRQVIDALQARRLEPIVTLHHFTTPQWLTAQGGWAQPKVVDHFAQYVQRVVAALGDRVRYWVTINEPMVFVNMHYVDGVGPPGGRDARQALRVIEHVIRAHAVAYHVIHQESPERAQPQVSVAKNLPMFVPCRGWWPLDRIAMGLVDRVFNGAFLDALMTGRWSVPGVGRWRIPEACQTLDYLGINFYGRQWVHWAPSGGWMGQVCNLRRHTRHAPELTDMGWDCYPPTLTEALVRAGRLGLRILVTENGIWADDDQRRCRFIQQSLAAVARAIERQVPVIGYCYWSLLDNFEWADGYRPRFGLVETDYATQQRRPRESARVYADICRAKRLQLEDAAPAVSPCCARATSPVPEPSS